MCFKINLCVNNTMISLKPLHEFSKSGVRVLVMEYRTIYTYWYKMLHVGNNIQVHNLMLSRYPYFINKIHIFHDMDNMRV